MNATPRRGTPDFLLLFLTFLLVCFGLAMVFSASYYIKLDTPWLYLKKQAVGAAIGTVGMVLAMNYHYTKLKKLVIPIFIGVTGLLLLVLLIGDAQYGSKSWINLGPLNLQPTEFAKLGIVLYLAMVIGKKGDKIRSFRDGLLPILIVLAGVAFLILLQPDFGSCMILLSGAFVVILVGGANLRHLLLLIVIGGALGALLVLVLVAKNGTSEFGYMVARVTSFMNPWSEECRKDECYQIVQSLYAFGHGGITGTGFGQGIQKLQYLPKAYNDFIFSIIGEEFGFLGSSLFLLVYLLFIWRGVIIALRCTDPFGSLAGVGIMSMIAIQTLVNIGGVTSSIPMTGVTLPFISYGGTSMMTTLFSVGILLGISREQSLTTDKPGSTKKQNSRQA